ncbi:P2X purinoceptor 7-like [Argopecten irradians]|uniref:P2X purinoceptor 7-like n=1 Tax=Argopecten irradians TaxID=31199 RepID=UPI00371F3FCA
MELSDNDQSDYDDIPEVSFSLDICPYMYEPVAQTDTQNDCSSPELSEDSDDSSQDDGGSTEWCSCSFCTPMPTSEERKCCHDMDILQEKLEGIKCITQHEGFAANCLNIHVLETSFYEYAEENDVSQENIHRTYRHVAYRRFIRWTWKVLGKRNRKVIPSCAVSAIRRTFPSEQFTGFLYPRF